MSHYNVYDFSDYRQFLVQEIGRMRSADPKLTYRVLAKKMKFSSSNYFHQLAQGKRNLSVAGALKCAEFLDLNSDEKAYFVSMVQFNQATTQEEKLTYQKQMFAVKGFLKFKPIEWAQYRYFSNWLLVVLREMISLSQFKPQSKLLAEQILGSDLSESEIDQALKQLVDLKLVDHSLENKYFQKETNLELPVGMSQTFVFAFHKAMLERAQWALLNLKSADREFAANTFTFESSQMKEARDFLDGMLSEFIARFGNKPNADSVYQFNFQLFEQATLRKKS